MTLTINAIYDLQQYDLALEPVHVELVRRGHIVKATRGRQAVPADASICIQDVGVHQAARPRFFITHGVSCVKGWGAKLEIDYYLASTPYWADTLARKIAANPEHPRFQIIHGGGWPRMDVWRKLAADPELQLTNRRQVCAAVGCDPTRPLIAYMPTYEGLKDGVRWTRPFDGMQVVKDLEAAGFGVFVVPHQMEKTADFAGKDRRILTGYGRARIAALLVADAFVGDRSGLVFECLIADKPIVLVNPTDTDRYLRLQHSAAGELLHSGPHCRPEAVATAVTEALGASPSVAEFWRQRRQYWREKVVGPCDGQHTARCVDAIEQAMRERVA